MQAEAAQFFSTSNRYVIERELGHGGMGVVFQALDVESNTRVALKALTHRDAVNIYRLKNEFRQLADLSHPNLVTLHELCSEGGSWFFTMELVNGTSFYQYCAASRVSSLPPNSSTAPTVNKRFLREASVTLSQQPIGSEFPLLPRITCNVRRLRQSLRQLVEAVAALHDAGKLHRDLKPSNVLVTPEGRVVVLDFGLVSSSTLVDAESQDAERTVGGCVFGTPAYMSPEQAGGETVTTASDWYSVGTMLYEALTGQLPFDGTILEILRQKDELEPVPPSEIVKGVPDDLDQLCRELLSRDPSKRPSGHEVLRYLTGMSAPPPVFDAQSSTMQRQHGELFVGRDQHLAALRSAFDATVAGKPITVLVHGLSGMGKTALVRCFANELIRGDEAVVLRGRCYERENVPYKAFDNIADALSRYLMGLPAEQAAGLMPRNASALPVLFPVLRRVKAIAHARRPKQPNADAREQRNQAFGALRELLLRITDMHPLVINIDDLQWADMDSARLLSFLMGPPNPPPLLLIGTYRRDELQQSPFLKQILGDRSLCEGGAELRELPVDALTDLEANQLANALMKGTRRESALLASTVAAEADGVPFFISELVQHANLREDRGELASAAASVSLDQVLMERVRSMPDDAQRLLEVLAVAAGPLEQGVAIEAARLPHGDRAALLALRAARLIRTRGTREQDTAETYHDRVREAVTAHLDKFQLRTVHARIADSLQRHDVHDPERLVVHYAGAGDGMRAGETAIDAADRAAQKLAFNRAAELYRKALELLGPNAGQRRELFEKLGDALANAGRGAQAAEAYLQAAEGLEGGDAALVLRAAQQNLRSGRVDEGLRLATSVGARIGVSVPTSTAGAVRMWLIETQVRARIDRLLPRARGGSIHMERELEVYGAIFQEASVVDAILGAALHARYARLAATVGEPLARARALSWSVYHCSLIGSPSQRERASQLLDEMAALVADCDAPEIRAWRLVAEAAVAFWSTNFKECIRITLESDTLFREHCPGSTWEQNWLALLRLSSMELSGDLRSMLDEAHRREIDARDRDDSFSLGLLALPVCNALLASDRPLDSLRFLDDQKRRLGDGFTTFHHLAFHRTVDTLLYLRRPEAALDYMRGHWTALKTSGLYRAPMIVGASHYQRARCLAALWTINQDNALLVEAKRDLRICSRVGLTYDGYALALSASIESVLGNHEQARKLLESALPKLAGTQAETYVKYRIGKLSAGAQGQRLALDAAQALRDQGVVDIESWIAMHLGRTAR